MGVRGCLVFYKLDTNWVDIIRNILVAILKNI